MDKAFARTELLLGQQAMDTLRRSSVAVFGIGGVGGYAVEALARSGVGKLTLVDHDTVSESNLNRQILALRSTIGQYKVDVAAARIKDIQPDADVQTYRCFYTPDTAGMFDFSQFDYVIDAIDTVTGKLELIVRAKASNVPIISAMGAGNKLHPAALEVADISKTSVCPLARVMRNELRRRGIRHLKVVYSREMPMTPQSNSSDEQPDPGRRQIPGSTAFTPSVMGLMIAGEVIMDLTGVSNPHFG